MELLNGKAKEMFLSFMCKKYRDFKWFEYANLLDVCQSAIIIEWLDGIGYYASINREISEEGLWSFDFTFKENLEHLICDKWYSDREEATTEAIKKAVELINKDYEQSR